MMNNLILKARSFRSFFEDKRLNKSTLNEIVNNIRNTASARNIQPLKYATVSSKELCDKVFPTLGWAGYLENGAPIDGERPSGYIIIFNDKNIATNSLWDQGIVSQTASLCAAEKELGCCILATINREQMKKIIRYDNNLEIALIIAVGYPKEDVRIIDIQDNDYKYFRDNGIHYVPKRTFEQVYIEVE